jgi:hypothetical protein
VGQDGLFALRQMDGQTQSPARGRALYHSLSNGRMCT